MNGQPRPFFIVGVHRSGTTLLRYMLCSHSRMYVPPETDFIPYFFSRNPTGALSDRRMDRILKIIFTRYRFVEEWQGNPPEFPELLARMPDRTPASFLDALYGLYAEQNGAERWGDKTPIYASYLDLIHTIFPQAQFLHILRDPFDAAVSLLEKYEEEELHIDIYFAARNWVRRIRHAQTSGRRLGPEHYYELRYENLVHEPEAELRGVCDYLGETFEASMLAHHRLARERIPVDSHFFASVRNPLHTQSLGRGRDRLTPADRRLVQYVAGRLMTALDYPLEDLGPLTARERARLLRLQAKYAILQSGRRVLQAVGLFPPI